MRVSNNADVFQTAEEHEISKLELLSFGNGFEMRKQVASAFSREVDPTRLEDGPNEAGTVESVRSGCAPAIWCSESLVDCRHKQWLKLDESCARGLRRRRFRYRRGHRNSK